LGILICLIRYYKSNPLLEARFALKRKKLKMQ
jgi:hypothetical protein